MKVIIRRQPGFAMRLLGMLLIIGTTGVASCQSLYSDKPAFYRASPPPVEVPVRGGEHRGG